MTTDEIKVITFVLVAVLLGAWARNYRSAHPEPLKPPPVPRYKQQRAW